MMTRLNDDNASFHEMFSLFKTPESELSTISSSDTSPKVSTTMLSNANMPLREYCIKASYNTAYTGTYMNANAIKYVLSRGCRFVDFEIYLIDKVPYVGYSADTSSAKNITSGNNILLLDALKYVSLYGFSSPSPNMGDPLFVQFRIQTANAETGNTEIYKQIGMAINNTIRAKMYTGSVSGDTPLNELMGKIVLIIDKRYAQNYMNYPVCDLDEYINEKCYNLRRYINMESGGDALRVYNNLNLLDQLTNPVFIHDDGITSNVKSMQMAVPEQVSNAGNPDIKELISDYGIQIAAYRFYVSDQNLEKYERLFSESFCAFVPFYKVIATLNDIDSSY
jgi:hypothetical protein